MTTNSPAPSQIESPFSSWKLLIQAQLWTLTFLLILFFVTGLAFVGVMMTKVNQFSQAAGMSLPQLKDLALQAWHEPVTLTNNYKNILLLGTDSLPTRGSVPPLTDTMMLVSLNLKNGVITTLPLPRDLWLSDYRTKINALYAYGQEKELAKPEQYPSEILSKLTNLPIHHTVVLSFEQVAEVIDLLGGIEVDVTQGFVDEQFPRTDVDVTKEKDPAKLYMRVEFVSGKQIMSGQRALTYIRSRHSQDLSQGTDDARSRRQQQVILSLVNRLRQKEVLTNPKILGQLLAYYQSQFEQYLPLTQAMATAKALLPNLNKLVIKDQQISYYPEKPEGLIWHPPQTKAQPLWVYEIKDIPTFQVEIKKLINP